MARARIKKIIPAIKTSAIPHIAQAFIIRNSSNLFQSMTEVISGIGLTEKISRGNVLGKILSICIVTDGLVPPEIIALFTNNQQQHVTVVPLAPPILQFDSELFTTADPKLQTEINEYLSISSSWVDSDIRIVVSRVKTDQRGIYSLCGATLSAIVERGNLGMLLEEFSTDCAIVLDPYSNSTLVATDHPLLADWVGSALMGLDPYSSRVNRESLRNGQLPRVYQIHGDLSPITSWQNQPVFAQKSKREVYSDSATWVSGLPIINATTAWYSVVREYYDSFLDLATSYKQQNRYSEKDLGDASAIREVLLGKVASAVSSESMGELLDALIKWLGLLLQMHPILRRDIATLKAVYHLTTDDRKMAVTATIDRGFVTVSRKKPDMVNVTLVFKDTVSMIQVFASPKPDLLKAMLEQKIAFDGNLSYLLKLAYILRRVLMVAKGEL